MSLFAIDDLARIVRETGIESDVVAIAGPTADTPFADLGYDSLALLDVASRIRREYGVEVDDDAVMPDRTPAELVDHVIGRARAMNP